MQADTVDIVRTLIGVGGTLLGAVGTLLISQLFASRRERAEREDRLVREFCAPRMEAGNLILGAITHGVHKITDAENLIDCTVFVQELVREVRTISEERFLYIGDVSRSNIEEFCDHLDVYAIEAHKIAVRELNEKAVPTAPLTTEELEKIEKITDMILTFRMALKIALQADTGYDRIDELLKGIFFEKERKVSPGESRNGIPGT